MLEYFIIASYLIDNVAFYTDHNYRTEAGADPEIFQWGVEEEYVCWYTYQRVYT